MKDRKDILSGIPEDMPAAPYLLGYAQAVSDLNQDWSAFRREAAKDILCAMTSQATTGNDAHYKFLAQEAIKQADELIKQLKEDKK